MVVACLQQVDNNVRKLNGRPQGDIVSASEDSLYGQVYSKANKLQFLLIPHFRLIVKRILAVLFAPFRHRTQQAATQHPALPSFCHPEVNDVIIK